MATPPFDINNTSPSSSALISAFPTDEQSNRTVIEGWLSWITDPTTGKIQTQALLAALAAINALTPAANQIPYFTGASTAALLDLTTLLQNAQINTITTAATGAWAGRLLVLKSGAPGLYLWDVTGSAQSALVSVDANVLTIYSSLANDGSDLTARLTLNLATGALTINGNATVNGTLTVTG